MRSDWRAGGHRTRLAVIFEVAVIGPEDSPRQLTASEQYRYVPRGEGTSSRLSRARRGACRSMIVSSAIRICPLSARLANSGITAPLRHVLEARVACARSPTNR